MHPYWFRWIIFITAAGAAVLSPATSYAGEGSLFRQENSGWFSLGTRNTLSLFNEMPEEGVGIGIGGQFRLQLGKRLNTEWYFDYLTSEVGDFAQRNDYHIGWSVMYYPGKHVDFSRLLQPYLILGHCFDYTDVFEKDNRSNHADRLSMATQGGIGTHFNITRALDVSLSGQYMVHFGKEVAADAQVGHTHIEVEDHTHAGGHVLLTVSANYKFVRLWGRE